MSAATNTANTAVSLEPSCSSDAASSSLTANAAEKTEDSIINSSSSSSASHLPSNPAICRFFAQGVCRFGSMCHYSHKLETAGDENKNSTLTDSITAQERPSTSRRNWVNAPIFIPKSEQSGGEVLETTAVERSWADVVGAAAHPLAGNYGIPALNLVQAGSVNGLCPYEGSCPYGIYCSYALHMELCEMCDQFCLHPVDETQRKQHKKECLQQHEQAMELSFAIARSKDKNCGICFDTIMEKAGREKRFGILPNCNHIFCLECIRKWRQAKQFEHKITRSCPECRVASDFVCPSAFWVETKEEKDKLLGDYRKALGIKDCKYFKKGDGKCPFGNKCFYKHALPNGDLVDVGCPKKTRKIHRSNNEIINLLDIYLYEFLDHREFDFLELVTSTSTESDDDYDDFDYEEVD